MSAAKDDQDLERLRRELRAPLNGVRSDLDLLENRVSAQKTALDRKADTAAVDKVRRSVEQHVDRLDQLRQDVDRQTEETDRVRAELGRRIDELDGRFEVHLRWLRRRIATADGEGIADLSVSELARTAVIAERGAVARGRLLTDAGRTALHERESEWRIWQDDYRRAGADVMAASFDIASSTPDSVDRPDYIRRFRNAVDQVARLRGRRDEVAGGAEDATRELAADDDRRKAETPVISEGHTADAELRRHIADLLETMVERAQLPPPWFEHALGLVPPPRDSGSWRTIGTDLIAYRITYGVTDPLQPLGAPPDAAASPHRRAWHERLAGMIAERGVRGP